MQLPSSSFGIFGIGVYLPPIRLMRFYASNHSQSLMIGEGSLTLYWRYCDAILAPGDFRVIESNSEKKLGWDQPMKVEVKD